MKKIGTTPNYMQFACALTQYKKEAQRLGNPAAMSRYYHAEQCALRAYKAKEYVQAEQWLNAARRASLNMC